MCNCKWCQGECINDKITTYEDPMVNWVMSNPVVAKYMAEKDEEIKELKNTIKEQEKEIKKWIDRLNQMSAM